MCSDDLQVQTIPLEYVEAARKLWEHPIDFKPRGIGEAGPSPDSQIARTIKRAVETAIIAQAGKEAAEYKKLAYRSPYELPPLASEREPPSGHVLVPSSSPLSSLQPSPKAVSDASTPKLSRSKVRQLKGSLLHFIDSNHRRAPLWCFLHRRR